MGGDMVLQYMGKHAGSLGQTPCSPFGLCGGEASPETRFIGRVLAGSTVKWTGDVQQFLASRARISRIRLEEATYTQPLNHPSKGASVWLRRIQDAFCDHKENSRKRH